MPSAQERLAAALASESLVKRSAAVIVKLYLEGLVAVLCTGIVFALPVVAVAEVDAWAISPRAVAGAWLTCASVVFSQIYCFSTTETALGVWTE